MSGHDKTYPVLQYGMKSRASIKGIIKSLFKLTILCKYNTCMLIILSCLERIDFCDFGYSKLYDLYSKKRGKVTTHIRLLGM